MNFTDTMRSEMLRLAELCWANAKLAAETDEEFVANASDVEAWGTLAVAAVKSIAKDSIADALDVVDAANKRLVTSNQFIKLWSLCAESLREAA